ncbi:MAG: DUF89 family protein [Ignavibacteria bacterium]|nr:DUF89 family protein [Ignavibacteria bacterium]
MISPGCIPCIVKQSYTLSKIVGIKNEKVQRQIIFNTLTELLKNKEIKSAPHFSIILKKIIGKYTDVEKSFTKVKKNNLCIAKKYLKYLESIYESAGDKLETAIRISITGNTIDLAANPDFDIEKEINLMLSSGINVDLLDVFKEDFERANNILFISDNYEEALFDKFLIRELLIKNVVFAVRSNNILNDMTLEDAKSLKIDRMCRVIESESKIAGTDLEKCNKEFLDLFNNSDIVIAKGQGNLETLLNVNRRVYFLFKVKCDVISELIGYPKGMGILYLKKKNI